MIKVGDLVRFSNAYLKMHCRRRSKDSKKFRGKNQIMRVLEINEYEAYGLPSEKYCAMAILDALDESGENLVIDVGWLSFHRRPKFASDKYQFKKVLDEVSTWE